MDRPAFVDAHLHLWDRRRLRYPWLEEADKASIAGNYLAADHRTAAEAWNLAGAIHVDAGAHPDDGEAETDWLNALADVDGLPTAIVARVELNAPDVDDRLARQAARRRVVGVRHLVNWHPDPARCAYDRDLTLDPAWRRGFGLLADHGFSFDFHGFPPQLAGLAETAAVHPGVALIVNHLGLPTPEEGLDEWRLGLRRLAEMPQVSIKLSGAGFIAAPFNPSAFADIVTEVIEMFGTERVMVASNFPTDRLFAQLDTTLGAYDMLLSGLSEDVRANLWGRNAARIYRLDIDL